jgi:hypothetical protein
MRVNPQGASRQSPSASPLSNADALALLDDLFSSPSTPRAKPVAKPSATKQREAAFAALPMHKAFAMRKTGYTTWKAIERVVVLQRQECRCCGEVTEIVKDEMFVLENRASHSLWKRHEGYGIEAPSDLPISIERIEEMQMVSACGACADWDFDILSAYAQRQLEILL